MTKFECLEYGFKLSRSIERNTRRISVLDSRACYIGIPVHEMVDSSSDGKRMERLAVEIEELKDTIQRQELFLSDLNAQYKTMFHTTGSDIYEYILTDRFINYLDWKTIAGGLGKTVRQTFRLRHDAIDAVNIPEKIISELEKCQLMSVA